MPGALHFYRSNRVEALAESAAELLATPAAGASPLDPEWLVVQGRGMAVWLRMELARRHGVWAGGKFLYPRNFVHELSELVLGQGVAAGYAQTRLSWAVLAALGDHLESPELAPLRRYAAGDDVGLRRYQLACRIADVFDQYATYRPEMLRAWEAGDDRTAREHGEAWQPLLWRILVERLGRGHAPALERELLGRLGGAPIAGLPPRVVVFGIASLPPMYVRVLAALARQIDVHWFLPCPASGYWADQVGGQADANSLLASLGRLGAELQSVLTSELEQLSVAEDEPAGDLFREPTGDSALAELQRDVFHARPRTATANAGSACDASISLHACHGPMREVEVLHDQLLDLLTRSDVRAQEIVVMLPDVDAYAPLVEAVFEREPGDPSFIPYRIADRHLRRDSPVVDAFVRLLGLVGGRMRASEVLDVLSLAPVQRRFGILAADLDVIRRWVFESGIRWGIDADHRTEHGQPREHANTWRFGLERLLLGYAMPAEGRELFGGALAYDEIEGQPAELLGKLATFSETLFAAVRELGASRPMAAWSDALAALLEAMLAVDGESAWEHRLLRRTLMDACAAASEVGFEAPVSLEVVRALLEDALADAEPARGFLSGGVTFCAMVPMRNIPFRVVCLLGLSDQAFPRARRPVDFDLMAKSGERRAGDRSRRDDDRYLFLEALLAARERVVIAYTGQSLRDGSELPPSVVVSELVEHLTSAEDGAAERWVVRHPLQSFSRRYFDGADPRLFSYASESSRAAVALAGGRGAAPPPLFDAPLAPPLIESLGLSDLVRFFEAPARFLMNDRLRVDLREPDSDIADREPVELGFLERWRVGDKLLALSLDGVGADESEALIRAEGILPPGAAGAVDHREVLAIAEPIAERVRALREGGRRPDVRVSERVGGVLLSGEVGSCWARGQLQYQFARVSGKQLLALWVRHLALCASAPQAPAFLVGRGPPGGAAAVTFRMRPVSAPEALLADLLALFRQGQERPLALFPRAAYGYARAIREGKPPERAIKSARTVFQNEELERDPHLRRAFGNAEVIEERGAAGFGELALRVMTPLLEHLEEV